MDNEQRLPMIGILASEYVAPNETAVQDVSVVEDT